MELAELLVPLEVRVGLPTAGSSGGNSSFVNIVCTGGAGGIITGITAAQPNGSQTQAVNPNGNAGGVASNTTDGIGGNGLSTTFLFL